MNLDTNDNVSTKLFKPLRVPVELLCCPLCGKKIKKISKHVPISVLTLRRKIKFLKVKSPQVFTLRTASQQLCVFKEKQLRGTVTS